jgi:hypothetical protein
MDEDEETIVARGRNFETNGGEDGGFDLEGGDVVDLEAVMSSVDVAPGVGDEEEEEEERRRRSDATLLTSRGRAQPNVAADRDGGGDEEEGVSVASSDEDDYFVSLGIVNALRPLSEVDRGVYYALNAVALFLSTMVICYLERVHTHACTSSLRWLAQLIASWLKHSRQCGEGSRC